MAATQAEYTTVANALLKEINGDIAAKVPSWERGFIPDDLAPALAGELAKTAIDTLDALRSEK